MVEYNKEDHINQILSKLSNQKLHVKKIIGTGHFSGVVVVKNMKLGGRLESIKFIDSIEPDERENFLKEGKILGIINHENIQKVYDILEHEDMYLYRFEYIEGFSLEEVLDEFKKRNIDFPPIVANEIILKLLSALEYVHNKLEYDDKTISIIHSDIKPSNIILSSRHKIKDKIDSDFLDLVLNNEVEPCLIDFGIAKFRGEKHDSSGTLHYLSPIQAGANGDIDWRTDLYQLMLVYSEMLTGKKPFLNKKRKDILHEKQTIDFKVEDADSIPKHTKAIIEKGTCFDIDKSYVSDRDCIDDLKKANRKEKISKFFISNKKPIIISLAIFFIISFSIAGYSTWDYHARSIDSLVNNIEDNNDPTIEELESSLNKIQKRGFEKKYLEPLKKGAFRDKSTGEPLYPSYIDQNGEWILVGPNSEEAGTFVGMLFEQSDEFPEALTFAVEYAEPILNSEFDGGASRRFAWALIPAYEATNDRKYLDKLIIVSSDLQAGFEMRKGILETMDLYHIELFIWLYDTTGEKRFLDTAESFMFNFMKNNIDDDGYVYYLSQIGATRPDGIPIPDEKGGRIIVPDELNNIGDFMFTSNNEIYMFKSRTGIFSRDFAELVIILEKMHKATGNKIFDDYLILTKNYYEDRIKDNGLDYLFVSDKNHENNIPYDSLASVNFLKFYKNDKEDALYRFKLDSLLNKENFRTEAENGILANSVWIESIFYDNNNKDIKNQSLILTDRLFLEI